MATKAERDEFEKKAKGSYTPPVPPVPKIPKEIFFKPAAERSADIEKWNKEMDDWKNNLQMRLDQIPVEKGDKGDTGAKGKTGAAGAAGATTVVQSSSPSVFVPVQTAQVELEVGELGLQRQVFVGQRGDNRPGKGTASDPYNANTREKFDAIMTNKIQPFSEIVLLPGTFDTQGYNLLNNVGWRLRPYCRLRGCGVNNTTLRLVDADQVNTHYYMVLAANVGTNDAFWNSVTGGYYDWTEVMDLTLDMNFLGQPSNPPSFTQHAVELHANHAHIRRVRVINYGNNYSHEGFLIIAGPDTNLNPKEVTDLLIEDCVIESMLYVSQGSGGISAISFAFGEASDTTFITTKQAIIRGNYVDGKYADGFNPYLPNTHIGYPANKETMNWAYGIGGGHSMLFEDNYSLDCWQTGPYWDTWDMRDVTIRNNRFYNCGIGPYWNGPGLNGGINQFSGTPYRHRHLTIEDNDIAIRKVAGLTPGPGHPYGMLLFGGTAAVGGRTYLFDEVQIRRNSIRLVDESTDTANFVGSGIMVTRAENLIIENNLIRLPFVDQPSIPHNKASIYTRLVGRMTCRNNRRPEDNSLILPWVEDLSRFSSDLDYEHEKAFLLAI